MRNDGIVGPFDPTSRIGSIPGMHHMPKLIGNVTYFNVSEAVAAIGCTDGWVRSMCREGRIPGAVKAGERAWLIPVEAAKAAKLELSSRANVNQAKKTADAKPKRRKK